MHQIILIIIKDVCGLGEGSAQKLNDNTFCLSLHNNESNSFLFVNATKIYQFKKKTLKQNHIHCFKILFPKILQSVT